MESCSTADSNKQPNEQPTTRSPGCNAGQQAERTAKGRGESVEKQGDGRGEVERRKWRGGWQHSNAATAAVQMRAANTRSTTATGREWVVERARWAHGRSGSWTRGEELERCGREASERLLASMLAVSGAGSVCGWVCCRFKRWRSIPLPTAVVAARLAAAAVRTSRSWFPRPPSPAPAPSRPAARAH